jgi:hypothetical protein
MSVSCVPRSIVSCDTRVPSVSHAVTWGRNRTNTPKRRIISTILRRVITRGRNRTDIPKRRIISTLLSRVKTNPRKESNRYPETSCNFYNIMPRHNKPEEGIEQMSRNVIFLEYYVTAKPIRANISDIHVRLLEAWTTLQDRTANKPLHPDVRWNSTCKIFKPSLHCCG